MSTGPADSNSQTVWLDRSSLLPSIWAALSARKWVIVGVTLLTFALTAAGTWLMKPSFVTSASLLLKKERFDAPVTPEQTLVVANPERRLSEEDLNSEVEILRSQSLLEEVVDRLHLERQFEKPEGMLAAVKRLSPEAGLSARERALLSLQTEITTELVKKSNIIRISYKTTDRELAAKVVNLLCDVYQERHVKLHQSEGARSFFAEQAKSMHAKLAEEETALRHISPLPNLELVNQQTEAQLRQLNEFEVALRTTRTLVVETEARISSINAQLAAEPAKLLSEERITRRVAPDAVRAQLFELELRRTELLTKYKPNHRLVLDLEKELQDARRLVAQAEAVPSDTVNVTTLNSVRQRLVESLAAEQSSLAALKEKERSLAEVVKQAQARLHELGEQGYVRRRLDREREIADSTYLLYAKKGEEARVSEALDKEGIINVRVAEPARVPLKPVSPNVALNLILGLIGGLALGLGATFVLEYLNPSPSRRQELASAGDFPAQVVAERLASLHGAKRRQ